MWARVEADRVNAFTGKCLKFSAYDFEKQACDRGQRREGKETLCIEDNLSDKCGTEEERQTAASILQSNMLDDLPIEKTKPPPAMFLEQMVELSELPITQQSSSDKPSTKKAPRPSVKPSNAQSSDMLEPAKHMMCDMKNNFVRDVKYRQMDLAANITREAAISACEDMADGNAFFVQQHGNGHTVCGVYDTPTLDRKKYKFNSGIKYGSVCTFEP